MSDLRIETEYLEAESLFRPSGKPNILVYVEDRDDVQFWDHLFVCIQDHYNAVDVTTLRDASIHLRISEIDSEGNSLMATGKGALMEVRGLGKTKVVAVDGDWDVISHQHKYSERIATDPYVIATTYYSIENHILTEDAINYYFTAYTGITLTTSYSQVLSDFCTCLSRLLPYVMVEDKISLSSRTEHVYSISDLRSDLKVLKNGDDVYKYKSKLENDRKGRLDLLQSDINLCVEELKKQGITVSEYWQVVQGHTLFDYVYDWLKHEVSQALVAQISSSQGEERAILSKKLSGLAKKLRNVIYYNPYINDKDKAILKIQSKIKKIEGKS